MSEEYFFRHLQSEEIVDLEMNGCTADNWENVKVASPFHAEHVCNVHFSGSVALGLFEKEFTLPGGVKKHSGIRNATLHNCEIGDNTLIENVHNYISNYFIGDDCFIQNVNVVYVEGRSSFGNNVEVSVLNETGGREVPIYNGLSASLAYLIALYRHRPALIHRLQAMIADFADLQTGKRYVRCAFQTVGLDDVCHHVYFYGRRTIFDSDALFSVTSLAEETIENVQALLYSD